MNIIFAVQAFYIFKIHLAKNFVVMKLKHRSSRSGRSPLSNLGNVDVYLLTYLSS